MRNLLILISGIILQSCIPVKIAPKFKSQDYKVIKAKKFQRKLPNQTSFIFKDPKDEGEFYEYLNTKLNLNHFDVGINSPFQLNGKTFYLSYNEVDKEDKTLNIGLAATNLVLSEKAGITVFDNHYTSRKGHWYLILTVYDDELNNCLLDKYPMKSEVLTYLMNLKDEYLSYNNYEEMLFKKKS